MNLLLDTGCFLWLAQEPDRLSARATLALDDPGNEIFLSDASVWEITLKHSAGRLALPGEPRAWIPRKVIFHGLHALSISREALLRSGELPRVHADPFDRLLAAQALEGGFAMISPDTPLSRLGAARIW